jgi:hypothetical protein
MGSKERQLSYSIPFKIEVMNYAEKRGNQAAERCFGLLPTEKMMIREWRCENNHEDDFSGSDDSFLGFYDE